jgi:hypothetical protein
MYSQHCFANNQPFKFVGDVAAGFGGEHSHSHKYSHSGVHGQPPETPVAFPASLPPAIWISSLRFRFKAAGVVVPNELINSVKEERFALPRHILVKPV